MQYIITTNRYALKTQDVYNTCIHLKHKLYKVDGLSYSLCVWWYVCMVVWLCMYVCMSVYVCMYVCMYVCIFVLLYVRLNVWLYVCMVVWLCLCIDVCM